MDLSPDMQLWNGRVDTGEGDRARRWHQVVRPLDDGTLPGIALLGFACDEGVARNQGRIGAAEGPAVLRRALAGLAWHPTAPLADAGDVACTDGDLAAAQQRLAEAVQQLVTAGHFPLVLGGGHETAYGTYSGLARACPESVIGIVNFDAHFDLRAAAVPTSGTPFAQIADDCAVRSQPFRYACLGVAEPSNTQALFDRARALDVRWRLDTEMVPWRLAETRSFLADFVASVDRVYLTIDLDVLPAAQMPAVSAPAGFGVELAVVETLVADLAASGKLAVADLVEFNPRFDQDSHGAKAAARLAWCITRHLKR